MKTWIERIDTLLSILIFLDIVFLIATFLMDLDSSYIDFFMLFDTALCIVLIMAFAFKLLNSDDKKRYLRENYLDLVASIPLNFLIVPFNEFNLVIVNIVVLVRFLRLLLLLKESYKYIRKFFNSTYLDKVIALFIVVIVGSTFALDYFDPSIPDLYHALWFVVQTVTTVGFGDVIPESPIGQFIALLLLVVGVTMFSVFTASFAYLFNDKVFREENKEFTEKINHLKEKIGENKAAIEEISESSSLTNEEISKIRESSSSTSEEISQIKEKLKESEENIKNLENRIDYLIELIEKKE